MTAFTDSTSAIRQRLAANWITTPIVYPNDEQDPPVGSFVYLDVQFGDAMQASIGSTTSRVFRHTGLIMIDICTPIDQGPGLGLQYADTIAGIFRGTEFSGVNCRAPYPAKQQKEENGKYWITTIFCGFYYDKFF